MQTEQLSGLARGFGGVIDMDEVMDRRWRTRFLPYDPGPLPTKPAPKPGEQIVLDLDGLPPEKYGGRSLRNPSNPRYERFRRLREEAIKVMDGRAWYRGPVVLDVEVWVTSLEKGRTLLTYVGGIQDTLDGGHGVHFTYLPVVYEDDCQVVSGEWRLYDKAEANRYRIRALFERQTT